MSDAKTRDTRVSLTHINNNYVRSDGSTPVSGSIDMRGNTLYNVSNPVNPQDVATKEYADKVGGGEIATVKTQYGTYVAIGNTYMRFYTLTNVRNLEDVQDVATKQYVDDAADKAFIFFEGKYLAVGDLLMGGRQLNNVGMPIENHQASNKFYVDTVIETATTGDKALRKIQDGIFASTGDIDMNGNSITALPNPIDRDAAANKNYVDNGGAITKLPNGAFTAVSDIDFDGFSLKNIPDPTDEKDSVNKAYVDGRTIQPSVSNIMKPIITVWVEEKGPLGSVHYELWQW